MPGFVLITNLSIHRSRKYQSTHLLVLLQRKAKVPLLLAPEPRRTWKVQRCMIRGRRTRIAWRDGPCRVQSPTTSTRSEGCWLGWTRRALPPVRFCSTFKLSLGRGRNSYSFLTILYWIKLHQYNTIPVLIYPVQLGVLRSLFHHLPSFGTHCHKGSC